MNWPFYLRLEAEKAKTNIYRTQFFFFFFSKNTHNTHSSNNNSNYSTLLIIFQSTLTHIIPFDTHQNHDNIGRVSFYKL